MSIGQPSNGVIELARHTKSPWCDCPCGIPFSHDNRPERSVEEDAYVNYIQAVFLVKQLQVSLFCLHSFVKVK